MSDQNDKQGDKSKDEQAKKMNNPSKIETRHCLSIMQDSHDIQTVHGF